MKNSYQYADEITLIFWLKENQNKPNAEIIRMLESKLSDIMQESFENGVNKGLRMSIDSISKLIPYKE